MFDGSDFRNWVCYVFKSLLMILGINLVAASQTVQENGVKCFKKGPTTGGIALFYLFSAAAYCYWAILYVVKKYRALIVLMDGCIHYFNDSDTFLLSVIIYLNYNAL